MISHSLCEPHRPAHRSVMPGLGLELGLGHPLPVWARTLSARALCLQGAGGGVGGGGGGWMHGGAKGWRKITGGWAQGVARGHSR
jgi:hypothetical protein